MYVMDNRIIKYFNQELSESERMQFIRDVNDDEDLKKDFVHYKKIMGLFSWIEQPCDKQEAMVSYNSFKSKHNATKTRRLYLRIAQYAAIVTLLIACTWYVSSSYDDGRSNNELTYNTINVPQGQRASVVLSDGTEVWLNAKSSLKYPSSFKKGERKVELIGEAYFDVAKDAARPFVVSTSELEVKVLGTVFNISNYGNRGLTNVSLLEGMVEVSFPNNKHDNIVLNPMQNLNYSNGKASLTKLDNENDFLWKQGIYYFENALLLDIVKKLELYYDAKIVITNPQLNSYKYTGKFRQRDGVYEILRIIQRIHKFKIEKDEVNNVYTLK